MLVLGSMLFTPVQVIPMVMLFIYLFKSWIIFLYMVEILIIISGG